MESKEEDIVQASSLGIGFLRDLDLVRIHTKIYCLVVDDSERSTLSYKRRYKRGD